MVQKINLCVELRPITCEFGGCKITPYLGLVSDWSVLKSEDKDGPGFPGDE